MAGAHAPAQCRPEAARQVLLASASEWVVLCCFLNIYFFRPPAVTSQPPRTEVGAWRGRFTPLYLSPIWVATLTSGEYPAPEEPTGAYHTHMHHVKNPKRHIPRVLRFLGWKNEGLITAQPSIASFTTTITLEAGAANYSAHLTPPPLLGCFAAQRGEREEGKQREGPANILKVKKWGETSPNPSPPLFPSPPLSSHGASPN